MNVLNKKVYLSYTHGKLSLIFTIFYKKYSFIKMANLCPPLEVRGITKLDREIFTTKVEVPCIKTRSGSISSLTEILKKYLLKLRNFRAIKPINNEELDTSSSGQPDSVGREIFLNPNIVSDFNDISIDDQQRLSELGIGKDSLTKCPLQLTYENWTVEDILSAILPEGVETAASYSLVGHIVHLNLRDHLLNYKYVIGEVLLDKIKQARTVVNKVDNIDNTFRVFNMEVLAGAADFVTEVKENGLRYKFDFSAVYWNSRLSTEHERLVKKISPGSVVYDVFAGVGPFSIPAGKKKCEVLANDLNPESFKWLQHNAKLNKVESLIKTYNKDGADFIKVDLKQHILQNEGEKESHVVMNLPAIATNFLHVFKNIFTPDQLKCIKNLPFIHVYCFVKGVDDFKKMAQEQVENELNCSIFETTDEIFLVRNVAPNKNMMRVSFRLTENIILGTKRKLEEFDECEITLKKVKTKPTMGKGGNQKKNKNVFKVAGARSLKAKKKAKAVTTNIKKLNEITKQGTEEVDKLLDLLQETVRKPLPVTNKEITPAPKVKEDREGKIEQFKKDAENSVEALDKLNKMEF